MKVSKNTFLMILLIAIFVLVLILDTNDKKREAQTYKQLVCEGTWPDYKNLKQEC